MPSPRARSLLRRASSPRQRAAARVDHFAPGIALGFVAGGTAILTHRMGLWLSLSFRSGLALKMDELPLLLSQRNPKLFLYAKPHRRPLAS